VKLSSLEIQLQSDVIFSCNFTEFDRFVHKQPILMGLNLYAA